MSNLPEGWTDDMNIPLTDDLSLEKLVDYVFESTIRRDPPPTIVQNLSERFGLIQADAELALDRACGGAVRAATGRADNCPAKDKDPVAWFSYQKCINNPTSSQQSIPSLPSSLASLGGDDYGRNRFTKPTVVRINPDERTQPQI